MHAPVGKKRAYNYMRMACYKGLGDNVVHIIIYAYCTVFDHALKLCRANRCRKTCDNNNY